MSISLTCEQCLYGDIVPCPPCSFVFLFPFDAFYRISHGCSLMSVMPYDLICCIALDGLS